jgi:hypothetical protein
MCGGVLRSLEPEVPASHMLASLGAESKKELSVLMRLPGGRTGDHMTLTISPALGRALARSF